MKIIRYSLFLLMILFLAFVLGCGSSPEPDDSDVEETMEDVASDVYYVLSHLVSTKYDEETEETIYTFDNIKFVTKMKEISLKSNDSVRKTDAIMEYTQYEEEVKSLENKFFVVFDDGNISLIEADANLLDESVKSANIISEEILCLKTLKQGVDWVSPNGTYSVVERYEYVVISQEARSAPSFKVVTYKDSSKSKVIRTVWWTPAIAWCCQWKDASGKYMYTLSDLDYDWDDD